MKQSLKYVLLVVMTLLLHSVATRAVDVVELSIEPVQEECFLSQASSVYNDAFEPFHIYYSDMPCEMGHTDISHVPTDKSFVKHFFRFREYKTITHYFPDHRLQLSIYSLSDPVSYYVFGLRKIIV